MKKVAGVLVALVMWVGCSKQGPPAETPQEPETIAVTRWTEKTELFMEYPPLVAGQSARFAVHFTDLRDFKPLAEGQVVVELRSVSGRAERFPTEGPSRPGIFGVDVKAGEAGTYSMVVRLEAAALKDTHQLGQVQVFADVETAAKAAETEEVEAISFLKEQQWTLDFATEVVTERALREGLRVPAEVRPRTGGEAEVTVPVAGRVATTGSVPGIGTSVRKGQILARIIPRTATPADRAALESALEQARAMLSLAQRDRERAERLLSAGAVPSKRLDEAKTAETTAEARFQSAQSRLKQHESSRSAEGDAPDDSLFLLRAPLAGVVAASQVTPGASVEEGETLFRIVSTDPVHVVASVPEAESSRIGQLAGGELELTGESRPLPLGRVVSIGRVVDPQSRTLPVIFEVRNPAARLAVGQSVFVRLFTKDTAQRPAVPESAVVDNAGRPVVFVQAAGESFVRRPVQLGSREGGHVHVLEGIKPGERVVTRGAYQVRLAALSTQIPAHGHVH